jgi:hypothetical protein
MLQVKASTSAPTIENPTENDLHSQNDQSTEKSTKSTMKRRDYTIQLVFWTLILMAFLDGAEASFKNHIKAPDELFLVGFWSG